MGTAENIVYYWAWPVRRDGGATGEYIVIYGTRRQIRELMNFTEDMLEELEYLPPGDQRRDDVDVAFAPREGDEQ